MYTHNLSDGRRLERLLLHNVAPVAGGVAHRQEDHLVLGLGRCNRFRSIRIPIDGIVGMLQEIRRLFEAQPVSLSSHLGVGEVGRGQ